jgi:hypothetical protein
VKPVGTRHFIDCSDRVGCTFTSVTTTISSIITNFGELGVLRVLQVHSSRRRVAFGLLEPVRRDGSNVRERPLPHQLWWRSSAPGPDHFECCGRRDFITNRDRYIGCTSINPNIFTVIDITPYHVHHVCRV